MARASLPSVTLSVWTKSLTTGAISALGREIGSVTRRSLQGVIQTDAAINPEIPVDRYSTARDV